MRTVPLSGARANGRVAMVDDEDYDLVMQYSWALWELVGAPGTRGAGPYPMTTIMRDGYDSTTRMHQVITGWSLTDHINHDGLDNRRSNLRPATHAENMRNARPGKTKSSPYKGVCWHKAARCWTARIKAEGRTQELGCFSSEVDAAHAYDAAARRYFGEFAYLNFPADDWVPPRRIWKRVDVKDATILILRDQGMGWAAIGTQVGMSDVGVRKRWLRAQSER